MSGPRHKRVVSDPISTSEVDDLLSYMSKPRNVMDLHVTRRFILALGAGHTVRRTLGRSSLVLEKSSTQGGITQMVGHNS